MIRCNAILAIRVIGVLLVVLGLWQLIANIIESIREFDPTYWWYYVQSELLRPLLGIFIGKLLYWFSKPMGALLAKGLETDTDK